MSASRDIIRSYRHPKQVVGEQISADPGEPRALAYLMIACFIMFIAQLPGLSRLAHLQPENGDFAARAGFAFVGAMFFAPLLFYIVAWVSGVFLKGIRKPRMMYHCRIALFWSLLALTPVMLLRGLTEAFMGQGPQFALVNLLAGVGLLWLWGGGLRAVAEANRTEPGGSDA